MKKEEIPRYRIRVHHQWNEIQTIKCNGGAWVQYEAHLNQLSETEEKLKDVYRKVLEDIYYDYTCPEYGGVTELCRYCEEEKGHKHDPDCIVLEAQNWLEDKE